jgi:BASS family bile acid:Na+ symporter
MKEMSEYIRKNTWLLILIAIIWSFVSPGFGMFLKPYSNVFLIGIMFLSCLDIEIVDIWNNLKNFRKQTIIMFSSQLIGPILILFLKPFLSEELFLGLILASAIPIGRSSVFISKIFNGETMPALVMSSISNALSPITVPFLVWVFAKTSIEIRPVEMGSTILWMVLVPILAAVLVRWTGRAKFLIKHSSDLSTILLFLIIIALIAPLRETILNNLLNSLLLLLLIIGLMIVNFIFGWKIGKKREEKVAFAVSASYKNYTLGTLIATSMFGPMVALPSIIYTITNNFFMIPLQLVFLRNK